MIKLSKAVEEELRTTVVQAYESESGKYGTYHINYCIYIYKMEWQHVEHNLSTQCVSYRI